MQLRKSHISHHMHRMQKTVCWNDHTKVKCLYAFEPPQNKPQLENTPTQAFLASRITLPGFPTVQAVDKVDTNSDAHYELRKPDG